MIKIKEKQAYTIKQVKDWLYSNNSALMAGILLLYNNQEEDEKQANKSLYHNNKGFNRNDTAKLTEYAHKITKMGGLYTNELIDARRRMVKYSKQICAILNEKAYKENGNQLEWQL